MPRASSSETPRKATEAPATKAPADKAVAVAKATKKASGAATPKKRATKEAAGGGATTDPFLEAQRVLLMEERATYTRQAKDLRAEAEQLAEDREPGDVQFDEESGQGDSMNVERERDLALSAQAMSAVDDIDRALRRMDAGTYGVCERCGEPIPAERLAALPSASLCVKCKSGGLSRR